MKRAIKIFVLILAAVILLLIIFRNYILKAYFESYAGKSLKIECRVKNVNLGIDFLSMENIAIKAKDFDITIKNATIKFKTQKAKPFFNLSDIELSGATLKISSLENLQNVSSKKPGPASADIFVKPIRLKLENINIALKSKDLEINSNFSIIADISSALISIKDASIVNLGIHSQDFEITDLNLRKFGKDKYLLKIPAVRIKDEKLGSFFIPIKAKANQLLFPSAKNALLGAKGYLNARCDFRGYNNISFNVNFRDISFEKIVDIFARDEASAKGKFNGTLKVGLTSFEVNEIQADFKNEGNGFINVKKESSFAFLKSYLDVSSYKALIDNFKNYEYNIGIIGIKKERDVLALNLDFISDNMGRRNIAINLHNISGGAQ